MKSLLDAFWFMFFIKIMLFGLYSSKKGYLSRDYAVGLLDGSHFNISVISWIALTDAFGIIFSNDMGLY